MDKQMAYAYSVASGPVRTRAIELHHQRYEEVGFFQKNEADPYEARAIYFTAQSLETREVVGVTRLIFGQLQELPTMQSFTIYELERARMRQLEASRIVEISAFTKLQAHDVGLGLIKTAIQYAYMHGISHWICCIDERVYHYMLRMFKFPFHVIGESRVYLGSTSIPCLLDLKECLSTLRELRPTLYDYLTDFELEMAEVLSQ